MKGKITLLVCMLIACAGICRAKGGYLNGYIVTNTGDTLYGTVKDRDVMPYIRFSKIKFKAEKGDSKMTFSSSDIKGYKRGDDNFESISCFEDTTVFVKVIHKGYLSLYKYETGAKEDCAWLLKKEDSPCVTEIQAGDLKGQLMNYFSDCITVRDRIEKKELNRDQLSDLVTIYNQTYSSR